MTSAFISRIQSPGGTESVETSAVGSTMRPPVFSDKAGSLACHVAVSALPCHEALFLALYGNSLDSAQAEVVHLTHTAFTIFSNSKFHSPGWWFPSNWTDEIHFYQKAELSEGTWAAQVQRGKALQVGTSLKQELQSLNDNPVLFLRLVVIGQEIGYHSKVNLERNKQKDNYAADSFIIRGKNHQ